MKFALPILAFAALVSAMPAEKEGPALRICSIGWNYCGDHLISMNYTPDEIKKALAEASQPTDSDHILYSLFNCDNGIGGIQFKQYCGVGLCVNAGIGRDDYCKL